MKILVTIQIDYDDEIGSFSCDALIYQIISKINGLTFETLDLFLFERMWNTLMSTNEKNQKILDSYLKVNNFLYSIWFSHNVSANSLFSLQ